MSADFGYTTTVIWSESLFQGKTLTSAKEEMVEYYKKFVDYDCFVGCVNAVKPIPNKDPKIFCQKLWKAMFCTRKHCALKIRRLDCSKNRNGKYCLTVFPLIEPPPPH